MIFYLSCYHRDHGRLASRPLSRNPMTKNSDFLTVEFTSRSELDHHRKPGTTSWLSSSSMGLLISAQPRPLTWDSIPWPSIPRTNTWPLASNFNNLLTVLSQFFNHLWYLVEFCYWLTAYVRLWLMFLWTNRYNSKFVA